MPDGAVVQSIGRYRGGRVIVTVHRGLYADAQEW
jgi:hypothetical protein